MRDLPLKIKLSYISGLYPVVFRELKKNNLKIIDEIEDSVYIEYTEDNFTASKSLRSVARAYLVLENEEYNPAYISKHKSILGSMVDIIVAQDTFKTFKISCAGSNSQEVRSIASYLADTYNLVEKEEADLKIHIIKPNQVWEIGIQITPRPLSVRNYRVENMSGAMDPTIAYAVNSYCNLDSAHTYVNVFSGSGTLLIEAALTYPNLEKLIGFDNDKEHLTISIHNIKKAGLMQRVQVKEKNIFDNPDIGMSDAIVSDLPFGMVIGKKEDLKKLYMAFVEYCESTLNKEGRLVIYTSQYELMESILETSQFKVIESLQLTLMTNVGAYLKARVIVCGFR